MEDDALVLNSLDIGESDLLLTLYCSQAGRINAIAKGARRSKKRFVNKLEIFSYITINFSCKKPSSLALLHEAELHTCFPHLRTSYPAYLTASVIQEFLLAGIKDGEGDTALFYLSLWALHNLQLKEQNKSTITFFLLRYLDCLGYRPELSTCGSCLQRVNPKYRYIFQLNEGTLLCCRCIPISSSQKLSHGTIKMLQTAQDMPLQRLNRLKPSASIIIESLQLLFACSRTILQCDINSWHNFLAQKS